MRANGKTGKGYDGKRGKKYESQNDDCDMIANE